MYINLAISDFGKVAPNFLFKEEVFIIVYIDLFVGGKSVKRGFVVQIEIFKSPELDS